MSTRHPHKALSRVFIMIPFLLFPLVTHAASIEIRGDDIDNDGDKKIDEVNTLDENGPHPKYAQKDPLNAEQAANIIGTVVSDTKGRIKVAYRDGSVYRYDIFPQYDGEKETMVRQYRKLGYYLVLHPQGRNMKLVNVFKGKVTASRSLTEVNYSKHALKFGKFGSSYIGIAVSKSDKETLLTMLRVKINNGEFGQNKDVHYILNKNVVPNQTVKKEQAVRLKNESGKLLYEFMKKTSDRYSFKKPDDLYVCCTNEYNCSDFESQKAAQAVLSRCKKQGAGDVHRLDKDSDGKACESLP